jgi:hypothetical protein
MKKKVYMVQMNLAGLHNCVYEMTYNPELKSYWDKSDNIECSDKSKFEGGITQLVFKTREDALKALDGAQMVARMIRTRLENV